MSYNMTGADTVKCRWVRDLASEFDVSFSALQEHFKTVKSTKQWFRKQFGKYHTYVVPAYRLPGVDSGRGRGGLVQLALRDRAVARARLATKSPRLQVESRHQDAGSPFDMGKQPLGRATKVTLSPPTDSSCAGLELVNMEEDCSYKCQSSDTHLSMNTDKYMLMPFASCS